jgi:ABC-type phosphate/phosphonate transport system permease subunit
VGSTEDLVNLEVIAYFGVALCFVGAFAVDFFAAESLTKIPILEGDLCHPFPFLRGHLRVLMICGRGVLSSI